MYSWIFFAYPRHDIQNPGLYWFPSHGDVLTLATELDFIDDFGIFIWVAVLAIKMAFWGILIR